MYGCRFCSFVEAENQNFRYAELCSDLVLLSRWLKCIVGKSLPLVFSNMNTYDYIGLHLFQCAFEHIFSERGGSCCVHQDVSRLHPCLWGGGRRALWGIFNIDTSSLSLARQLYFASISKTLLPPGASGARRVCGAGQHPGSVPGNHWHQISQPSNSGLLAADLVVIWLLINHTRMFFIKRLENTSQNIISWPYWSRKWLKYLDLEIGEASGRQSACATWRLARNCLCHCK